MSIVKRNGEGRCRDVDQLHYELYFASFHWNVDLVVHMK